MIFLLNFFIQLKLSLLGAWLAHPGGRPLLLPAVLGLRLPLRSRAGADWQLYPRPKTVELRLASAVHRGFGVRTHVQIVKVGIDGEPASKRRGVNDIGTRRSGHARSNGRENGDRKVRGGAEPERYRRERSIWDHQRRGRAHLERAPRWSGAGGWAGLGVKCGGSGGYSAKSRSDQAALRGAFGRQLGAQAVWPRDGDRL